mmetsp:Transcript_24945/g.72973  ORF Transcript_24945/g.72973 Transcript_24945/m.72973 type:complete len:202 (-) Transcript_24945:185-790(-)
MMELLPTFGAPTRTTVGAVSSTTGTLRSAFCTSSICMSRGAASSSTRQVRSMPSSARAAASIAREAFLASAAAALPVDTTSLCTALTSSKISCRVPLPDFSSARTVRSETTASKGWRRRSCRRYPSTRDLRGTLSSFVSVSIFRAATLRARCLEFFIVVSSRTLNASLRALDTSSCDGTTKGSSLRPPVEVRRCDGARWFW